MVSLRRNGVAFSTQELVSHPFTQAKLTVRARVRASGMAHEEWEI